MENEKKKSGLATASLVLGIVGIVFSFIPVINILAYILVILGIIFGVISLCKKASTGMAIAGIIICVLAILIAHNMNKTAFNAVNNAVNDLNTTVSDMTGDNTEKILSDYADVKIGDFKVDKDKYGLESAKLTVTVKNKSDEKKSFDFHIEATDSSGNRIDDGYVYANDLGAGQTQDFEIFNSLSEDTIDKLKDATFKIVDASMY